MGRGVRRQLAVQGQGHGVRLADLHRRRRALPDEDQARPGHQEPVRAGRQAVRRRGRPAQDAEHRTSASTGRTTPRRSQAFKSGDSVVGTTWQIIANLAQADKKVRSRRSCPARARPAGRTPGWSPPRAKHPTCCLQVDGPDRLPEGERPGGRVVRRGAGPASPAPRPRDKNFCTTFHADDEAYFDQVWYWTTPIAQCLDGRTNVTCKDYGEWTQAWTGDQGLTVTTARPAGGTARSRGRRRGRSPAGSCTATRGCGWCPAARCAAAVARRRLPRLARGPVRLRVLDARTSSPATSSAP